MNEDYGSVDCLDLPPPLNNILCLSLKNFPPKTNKYSKYFLLLQSQMPDCRKSFPKHCAMLVISTVMCCQFRRSSRGCRSTIPNSSVFSCCFSGCSLVNNQWNIQDFRRAPLNKPQFLLDALGSSIVTI